MQKSPDDGGVIHDFNTATSSGDSRNFTSRNYCTQIFYFLFSGRNALQWSLSASGRHKQIWGCLNRSRLGWFMRWELATLKFVFEKATKCYKPTILDLAFTTVKRKIFFFILLNLKSKSYGYSPKKTVYETLRTSKKVHLIFQLSILYETNFFFRSLCNLFQKLPKLRALETNFESADGLGISVNTVMILIFFALTWTQTCKYALYFSIEFNFSFFYIGRHGFPPLIMSYQLILIVFLFQIVLFKLSSQFDRKPTWSVNMFQVDINFTMDWPF